MPPSPRQLEGLDNGLDLFHPSVPSPPDRPQRHKPRFRCQARLAYRASRCIAPSRCIKRHRAEPHGPPKSLADEGVPYLWADDGAEQWAKMPNNEAIHRIRAEQCRGNWHQDRDWPISCTAHDAADRQKSPALPGIRHRGETSCPRWKLITTEEMARADRLAIAAGTTGVALIEAASHASGGSGGKTSPAPGDDSATIAVACRSGNNGGNGFVAAHLLHEAGPSRACGPPGPPRRSGAMRR